MQGLRGGGKGVEWSGVVIYTVRARSCFSSSRWSLWYVRVRHTCSVFSLLVKVTVSGGFVGSVLMSE